MHTGSTIRNKIKTVIKIGIFTNLCKHKKDEDMINL